MKKKSIMIFQIKINKFYNKLIIYKEEIIKISCELQNHKI